MTFLIVLGIRVDGTKLYAYFYHSIPVLLVPGSGKTHYFGVTEPNENKVVCKCLKRRQKRKKSLPFSLILLEFFLVFASLF